MKVTKQSVFTGKIHTREIPVTEDQLADWRAGTLIQHAMPHLSADDREFLMTGITPEEWAEAFGKLEPVATYRTPQLTVGGVLKHKERS